MNLRIENLTKRFGGLVAVDGVSAEFSPGRITGLVGPNGAGKTTIFNLMTGVYPPSAGRVVLDGRNITGAKPHQVARLGIGRTFQHTRIFHHLTVAENVLLARPEVTDSLLLALRITRRRRQRWLDEAVEHLRFVGLHDKAEAYGGDLSYAEQKLVMFACLLASGARVLLLDEPTAGLDPSSHRDMIATVTRLSRPDTTIVLIEHNLDVVRGCCERVIFLAEGAVRRLGTVAEVESDPALKSLYFGGGGANA